MNVISHIIIIVMVDVKPGRCYMEDRQLPMQQVPPLHVADGSKGTAGPLQFGRSCQKEVVNNDELP